MTYQPPADRLGAMRDVLLAERARRTYEPRFINEQQRTFFESRAPEVLYSGAFRAGKSRIGCEKAYALALRYPGIPIGIFRKVAASLPATTERTLVVDVLRAHNAIAASNSQQHWYELANGSRIWLFGLDPDPLTGVPSKVGSVELGFAFADEAAEMTEADWVMMKGRLSWPGIPYHQLAAATNPASPKHWLKRRFTPASEKRVFLHASTLDNPALPADYLAEAAEMADGVFRQRYILGEWVAAEGVIWALPDAQIAAPPAGQVWKRVVAGLDWGVVHATALEVVGQTGAGRLAVLHEVYERGQTIEQLLPRLLAAVANFGIARIYADPSEPEHIATCRRAGLPIEPATNDVLPGIQAVTDALRAGMTISPACEGLLEEIPSYVWQPDRAAGGLKEKPVEVGDDGCDALRYGIMGLAAPKGWGAVDGSAGGVA